jgi:two-component system sensor kinase FixL
LHPEDREPTREAVRCSLKGGGDYFSEYRVGLNDGSIRWIAAFGRVELDGNGHPLRMRGGFIDITERKHAESELQRNREQLAHVTRVSTMGELATSLAHEINQPLTAILSNAQAAQRFLSAKPVDLDEVLEILEDIVTDNSRAGEVIHRVRALVKKGELAFAPINIAGVIGDVVQLVHSDGILRNIRVELECQDGLPSVRGDRVQLQQVVLNLLINAFDAMKEATAKERNVKVRAKTNGAGTVEISVRDHGTGLTSDELAKISSLSTLPSAKGSAWDFPLVGRLPKPMGAGSGRRTTRTKARHFISLCRQSMAKHPSLPPLFGEPSRIHKSFLTSPS